MTTGALPVPVPVSHEPTALANRAPSELEIARVIALYSEELLDERQVQMLSGLNPSEIPLWMADPGRVEAVHRATLEMQNSGALARLEACRHARDMVKIAAGIARNEDIHASTRLAGATFVAKAAGTEKPPEADQRAPASIKISINFGPQPENRRVIEAKAESVHPDQSSHRVSDERS